MLRRRNTMQSDATPNINGYRILEIESFTYIYIYRVSDKDSALVNAINRTEKSPWIVVHKFNFTISSIIIEIIIG